MMNGLRVANTWPQRYPTFRIVEVGSWHFRKLSSRSARHDVTPVLYWGDAGHDNGLHSLALLFRS